MQEMFARRMEDAIAKQRQEMEERLRNEKAEMEKMMQLRLDSQRAAFEDESRGNVIFPRLIGANTEV